MKNIVDYLRRRPQTRLALIRLLLYLGGAVIAKTALDADTLYILLAALAGVADVAGTGVANSSTTPMSSPRLGVGEPPPELVKAAQAVSAFLPAPIGEIFTRYGAEGAWLVVRTAAKRAPTQAETDKKATEGL